MKNLFVASALVMVSACTMQQKPAPYVDHGDKAFFRENVTIKKDGFKEISNPALESSRGRTSEEYIDSHEVSGREKIKTTKIEPPQEKKIEEKKPEKVENQMAELDNIKPKSKPKLKEAAKPKAKEVAEEAPVEEKPVIEKAALAEPVVQEKEPELIKADPAKEEEEVIKLPAKVVEKKSEEKPAEKELVKEVKKEEEKHEPVKVELKPEVKAEAKPEPKVEMKAEVEKPVEKVASGKFLRPIDGVIIRKFGEKNGSATNDGINIQAAEGTPVKAAEGGSVVYSGNQLQGYGNLVIVKHPSGYLTAYAHLQDLQLKKGDEVKQADVIGHVGKTGNVDQPQLHFGVRKGRDPVDPEKFL